MSAIRTAVEKVGGQYALARVLGVTQGLVSQWCVGIRAVAERHCAPIERATAGSVRCEDLRPDVAWVRDPSGQVTGYTVPVAPPANEARAA